MLEAPAGSPSTLSRHILWNGVLYLAVGAALYLAPYIVRTLLFMERFAGREEG